MSETQLNFRTTVKPGDMEIVRDIVTSTGFFYDFEVPVAVELVEDHLKEGIESGYHFLFAEIEGKTVAYSCFGPIAGTSGSFDLFWIVTHNDYRGKGIGVILLEETHKSAKKMGARILIAETSTLDKYQPTRHFYEKNNYHRVAMIPDFYQVGDGKVFYVKTL